MNACQAPPGAPARLRSLPLVSIFLVSTLLFALAILAAGCGSDPADLVGTWVSQEQGETLELRYDGTALLLTNDNTLVGSLRWDADSRKLVIGPMGGETQTFSYSIRDGVLKLSYPGEETVEYIRSDVAID